MEEEPREGQSLAETPTWAVATVITVMVSFGFFFHGSLKWSGKWLAKTKSKPLLAALERIKEELMLFGLLSLLMGHWIAFVAKICVKSSSVLISQFYPCALEGDLQTIKHILLSGSNHLNHFIVREQVKAGGHNYCPEGHESFASYESLEQLHRLVFVLGITHVIYSFIAIALAMIKQSLKFSLCRSTAGEHGKMKLNLWLSRAYKVNSFPPDDYVDVLYRSSIF
nr:mlo-like protein 14 [Quercus suber]